MILTTEITIDLVIVSYSMKEGYNRPISLQDASGTIEEHNVNALLHFSRWNVRVVQFTTGDRPVCYSQVLFEVPLVLAVPRSELEEVDLGRTQLIFHEHPVCPMTSSSIPPPEAENCQSTIESFFVLYQPTRTIETFTDGDTVQAQISIVYIHAGERDGRPWKSTGACFLRGALAKTFPSPSSPCEVQPLTWFSSSHSMVANIGNGLIMIRPKFNEGQNLMLTDSNWIIGSDSPRLQDFTLWNTIDSPIEFVPYFWSVEDLMQQEMRGDSNHFGVPWSRIEIVDYFLHLLPAVFSPSEQVLCTLCILHRQKATSKTSATGNLLWTRLLFTVDLHSAAINTIAQYPPSTLILHSHIHDFTQQLANKLLTSSSGDWLSWTKAQRHGALTASNDISIPKLDHPLLNLSLLRPIIRHNGR